MLHPLTRISNWSPMTTGSFNRDLTFAIGNSEYVVRTWQRSWSGTDDPIYQQYLTQAAQRRSEVKRLSEQYQQSFVRYLADLAAWTRQPRIVIDEKAYRKALSDFTSAVYREALRPPPRKRFIKPRKTEFVLSRRGPKPKPPPKPRMPGALEKPPKRVRRGEHEYLVYEVYEYNEFKHYAVAPPTPNFNGMLTVFAAPVDRDILLGANDELVLIERLREKMLGSDFNMSVLIGESHETFRLIGDTAIRIAKAAHFTRKGDFSGAVRVLKGNATRASLKPSPDRFPEWSKGQSGDVAKRWLELQYGWMPLYQDIHGAAKALAHQLNVPLRTSYRSNVKAPTRTNTRVQRYGASLMTTCHATMDQRVGLIARISELPSIPKLLGLLDPQVVAWELLPFSFVVDWVIPIGSWIEARSFAQGLRGTFIRSDKRWQYIAPPYGSCPANVSHRSAFQFHRTVSQSLDVPMPRIKPLSEAASVKHCLNGIALLTAAFTSGKPKG